MLDELRRHGYRIGPGTLYPMLHRLEERGYLRAREERKGKMMRRYYSATHKGREALAQAKPRIIELFVRLSDPQWLRKSEQGNIYSSPALAIRAKVF